MGEKLHHSYEDPVEIPTRDQVRLSKLVCNTSDSIRWKAERTPVCLWAILSGILSTKIEKERTLIMVEGEASHLNLSSNLPNATCHTPIHNHTGTCEHTCAHRVRQRQREKLKFYFLYSPE